MPRPYLAAAALAALIPAVAVAETEIVEFDRMSVIGDPSSLGSTPGSAHLITQETLEQFKYDDIHRVLRLVPGVYVVEEEGLGLRPNVGMRGSGTSRSARITLLEDGVLIAPAPYAAPSAYYFPTTARMSGIEVRKGSAGIKHGPYTVGGALNLLSTPIPAQTSGRIAADLGQHGARNLHAWTGGREGDFGWLIETVQQSTDGFKRLDTGGDTGYTLSDYVVKLDWAASPDHLFELKLGYTEQDGDETYTGLSAADFAAAPYRRYAGTQRDNITTEHDQVTLRHEWRISESIDLTTIAYDNGFDRAWYRLTDIGGQSVSAILADTATHATEYGWLTGATSPDDAFTLANNARSYFGRGVQSVLGWQFGGGAASHTLEIGLRVHEDGEDRLENRDGWRMQDGTLVRTTAGAPGSSSNRVVEADAVALFVEDRIELGAWTLTPGLRHERIRGTRLDYATTDPGRLAGPTRVRESSEDVTIPGLGLNRALGDHANVFAAVHRGFTPPAPGSTSRAEDSVNYELGWRYLDNGFRAEVVGFYNDYSNLVGTCSAATGGGCVIGDQFDGGEVSMHGLEITLGHGWQLGAFRVPVNFSYTLTSAEFETSFTSGFGEFGTVQAGDELPYLPEHQARVGIGLEHARWQTYLGASWTDDMRTVAGRGTPPREQRTDSYLVLDLAGTYELRPGLAAYARIDNLLDNTYLVAWRPFGARPGKPRTATIGVAWNF